MIAPLNPTETLSNRLTVDASGSFFLLQGKPTFVLADTLWAAFSRMTDAEWSDAMRLRRRQGFNAVNISILPVAHDRSLSSDSRSPFLVRSDGSWDMDALDSTYFERAGRMVSIALENGIVPILGVLWCNYVPNTWGAAKTPDLVMTESQSKCYVGQVIKTFGDSVIYCISGDDHLDDSIAVARYVSALHQVKLALPAALTTFHSTPRAVLPANVESDPALTYYAYQAGHDVGWEERSEKLPRRYTAIEPRKPVVSMEPCYEGHGFGAGHARHDARDVRRASWVGVLCGAGAGLGYAAHGAWSWHRAGDDFNGEHFSGIPLPATRAMELPGAWDMGLLRRLVEHYGLYALRDRQEHISNNASGAVFAVSEDGNTAAAYLPEAFCLTVSMDFSGWDVEMWDLASGRRDFVEISVTSAGHTTFAQPDFIGDLLYVMKR